MLASTSRRALAALAVLLAFGFGSTAFAAAKWVAKAEAANCAACHGADKVLPEKHKPVKGMKLADCRKCHEPKTDDALSGRFPMAHTHLLAGKGCESCHGKGKPKPVDMDKCVTCHDAAKVAAATASVQPKNPHDSPHYGPNMECGNCHLAHGKSENYCAQCHKFEFKVP